MVAANLVRLAEAPLTLYLIAPELDCQGLAYGTRDAQHLLNVPANKMGAFADKVDGFWQWLSSGQGALAKQRLGIAASYGEASFMPRMLYGAYLQDIWAETQQLAAQKNVALKHVPTMATAIQRTPLAVLTQRGDAIAVDDVVLATGNENKPLPAAADAPMVQNPWAVDALNGCADWASPVALIGTGLTSVDMLLSLRALGYTGEIVATSLRGQWPRAHKAYAAPFMFDETALLAQKTLRQLVRFVRQNIAQHEATGGDWRAVADALRPHTNVLWRQATTADKLRFFRHVMIYWSTHRHRCAPEIEAAIEKELASGLLRSMHRQPFAAVLQQTPPSHILNCTGFQLDVRRSRQNLWKQLVAECMVEPHETGLGIKTDAHGRALGEAYPNLYALGTVLTGQWMESTAVPELRVQAFSIARAMPLNGE
jgi:uncharacterized NAD(P)/FAD-binding protein YdhS